MSKEINFWVWSKWQWQSGWIVIGVGFWLLNINFGMYIHLCDYVYEAKVLIYYIYLLHIRNTHFFNAFYAKNYVFFFFPLNNLYAKLLIDNRASPTWNWASPSQKTKCKLK